MTIQNGGPRRISAATCKRHRAARRHETIRISVIIPSDDVSSGCTQSLTKIGLTNHRSERRSENASNTKRTRATRSQYESQPPMTYVVPRRHSDTAAVTGHTKTPAPTTRRRRAARTRRRQKIDRTTVVLTCNPRYSRRVREKYSPVSAPAAGVGKSINDPVAMTDSPLAITDAAAAIGGGTKTKSSRRAPPTSATFLLQDSHRRQLSHASEASSFVVKIRLQIDCTTSYPVRRLIRLPKPSLISRHSDAARRFMPFNQVSVVLNHTCTALGVRSNKSSNHPSF